MRILRMVYRLVTVNLWLRTAILAGVSVGLIILAFHWQVMSRPTVPAYLAAQLGTGLLVGAVGAALVQAFVMSAPETLRKMIDELRAGTREASQTRLVRQLASLSEMTSRGVSKLETRMSGLEADLGAHDRRTRTAAGEALSGTGLVNVYASWDDATAEMSAAVTDPQTTEIQLLGLGLTDWFGGRRSAGAAEPTGRLLEHRILGDAVATANCEPLSVLVLLLDPDCAAARLLTRGADGHESGERLERLRSETRATAEHLSWLRRQVAERHNGNSLQVNFYRSTPGFFAFTTNLGSFVRPYYVGLDSGPSLAPVWQYSARSAVHEAVRQHFDVTWHTISVPCEEPLTEKAAGVDRGIGESGICNIYSDLASAQDRISWLIRHARRRVWIQGVSLVHHLSPPLEDAVLQLLRTPAVDSRLLILDPDSEQAYFKSHRDYLLDLKPDAHGIDFAQYLSDPGLHKKSLIYTNIRHSAQRLTGMAATSTGNFQLRYYTCAPTSYMLIADDRVLVEQFHYGKPPMAADSMQAQLHLTREMPLIEYRRPEGMLFERRPELDPLAVAEDHFSYVFEHLGIAPRRTG